MSILNDAFSLAQASQLDYPTTLDMTRYMAAETEMFPWRGARYALSFISERLYGHEHFGLWRVRKIGQNCHIYSIEL